MKLTDLARKTDMDAVVAQLAQRAHERGQRILIVQVDEKVMGGGVDQVNDRIVAVEQTGLYRFRDLSARARHQETAKYAIPPAVFYVTFEAV